MAQTINGIVDGNISSHRAKLYIHMLRDKIDLLLWFGNSVRIDKPILDTRYVKGKEPDVLYIVKVRFFLKYSSFSVPNRKVIINNDLFKFLDYKFVMVEGVYKSLDILKEKIDFFVLIISPKNALNIINVDFEIIWKLFRWWKSYFKKKNIK